MEALKQRIAESARKAGLDSEFDVLERLIKVRSFAPRASPPFLLSGLKYPLMTEGASTGGRVVGRAAIDQPGLRRPRRWVD